MRPLQPKAKKLLAIAKYPVALAILFYVLGQADTEKIADYLKQIPPLWLVLSFVCFATAQFFAVWRMNDYYHSLGRPLDFGYALRLHYVSLFYNIVLPGGIGGDGYKIFLLKKQADYPAKEGIRIQLATRTNGLLILLLTIAATLFFLPLPEAFSWLPWAGAGAGLIGIFLYFEIIPRLLRLPRALEWQALPYSIGLQLFNVLCMVCLYLGLGDGTEWAGYVLLFQCAAIAGMIPISIGGLGIREFTFFYGAALLNDYTGFSLNPELGVVISLLVFAITLASALIGLLWMGRISQMKPCAGL